MIENSQATYALLVLVSETHEDRTGRTPTSVNPQIVLLLKIIITNGAAMALPTKEKAPNFHAVSRSRVRA
jgi:hypothetical protein